VKGRREEGERRKEEGGRRKERTLNAQRSTLTLKWPTGETPAPLEMRPSQGGTAASP
jgi:hypothetical protein